ncbi:cryptochrome/photolyase family protein [Vibrio sp. SA48]
MQFETVRLILGDQLNSEHSWFQQVDDKVLYLIAELKQENTYVTHHVQKVCAFFSAMKQFAQEKQSEGHQVLHLTLDDTQSFADLNQMLKHYVTNVRASKFEYQRPDEYRLLAQMANLKITNVVIRCVDSEHFLLPFEETEQQFPQGKHVMMEYFYRRMRKRFDILMQDGKPVGGKWNYDANNRNKLKANDIEQLPQPMIFRRNVGHIIERLKRHNIHTIGSLNSELIWPINRCQSLSLLAHFCQVCLPLFGRFQDAMISQHQAKWSLYHSRLSFSLNTKLLHPKEVIMASLNVFYSNPDIDLSQVEGFIRQILGWREYIRGIYWANMPNTRGMALFADGGIVGTKPYAASGSYINKMSDYCKGCHYDHKVRSGKGSCPFNSLYWRFMDKHQTCLASNPRIGMIFRSWDNMEHEQRTAILDTAEYYIANLENL